MWQKNTSNEKVQSKTHSFFFVLKRKYHLIFYIPHWQTAFGNVPGHNSEYNPLNELFNQMQGKLSTRQFQKDLV